MRTARFLCSLDPHVLLEVMRFCGQCWEPLWCGYERGNSTEGKSWLREFVGILCICCLWLWDFVFRKVRQLVVVYFIILVAVLFRSGGGIGYAPLRGVFRCWVCISIQYSFKPCFCNPAEKEIQFRFFTFNFLFLFFSLHNP